ncbi:DUF433 domain-containing protein [Rudanella paleaurantiibacter]|uniref:DUF433 domain-containing protein n=1 Tax=Rudanella paleaurantiibacter TaxID=2614655 RepID=A0A7J5TY27_9BACT|nr:DUF433 domain-containing protein [Rudanella paleaurantiibacter]KAB7730043.1 DUF433 domain-containing protein [Rudanella paleaurantiibacter]
MNYREIISINPNIRFGRPCITGTRISVYDVLGWMAAGMNIDEILDDFPHLTREQILACLAWAADRDHHVKVVVSE